MTTLSPAVQKDVLDLYTGYDKQKVGIGLLSGAYATPEYEKKKIKTMMIGAITECVYSGMELDPKPAVLALGFEPRYNTIIGLNLNYIPPKIKRAVLKYILDANAARIASNQPLLINYDSLKRAVPQVTAIVRRYKNFGIRPIETYQLAEWPEFAKKRSRYETVYTDPERFYGRKK